MSLSLRECRFRKSLREGRFIESREKACKILQIWHSPQQSFSLPGLLSLCGGNDFDCEDKSDDEDPDNEELLNQNRWGLHWHSDETGPPISKEEEDQRRITTDYDLDQRKEILSK